jgi:hypothetical protein
MDADDIPEFAAPVKKAAPKAPKPPSEFSSVKALRYMHIDPADIMGYFGDEKVSLRFKPGDTIENLKTAKAQSLISRGFASAV